MHRSGRLRSLWQWSFGTHVIALVIAGILPLAGLGFYSMMRLGDAQREVDRSQIINTARAISSSIDQQLLSAERSLRALGSALPQSDDDLQEFYGDCRAIARESGGWILLADREGRQIFNTKQPLGAPLPSVPESREFRNAIASGQPQISGVLTGVIDSQPEFAVHVPILEDGAVTRVLTMTLATSTLNEFLGQQNLPEDWTVSTVDRTGTIFARHPRADKIVGMKASQDILDMPESRSEGFFRLTNRENTDVYIASVRSARSGWRVNVGIPVAVIDAPLRQNLRRFSLLGGGALLLAIGAAAFIGRHLANTMKTLASAAYAIGRHRPMSAVSSTVREVNRVAMALSYAGTALAEGDRQLRRSEQHLLRAQHVGRMGSIDCDLKTGEVECTDEFFRIMGIDRASFEPTTENFLRMVHEEDREQVRARTLASRRGVKPPPLEYRIVRPDGEVRTLHSEAELSYDADGAPVRLFIVLKDVTELRAAERRQHELERQLQHAQKIDALGTLAGGIAHDLNNTLVPVLGLAKITMRHLPEGGRERANLAVILRAGERARDLVRQILAFSRDDAPTREPIDLALLVRDALKIARASVPSTVHIAESIEAAPPVLGDAGQLLQVVINLVVNAAHAIGSSMGTITIALGTEGYALPEGVDIGAAGLCARLSVGDTGCGMDAATLPRIFEPFFTTKPVGEGTGLGLSIVHGIVVRHGGRIAVESQVGQGTRVDVLLPALIGDQQRRFATAEAAE